MLAVFEASSSMPFGGSPIKSFVVTLVLVQEGASLPIKRVH